MHKYFSLHTNYFLLPWKNPELVGMLFNNYSISTTSDIGYAFFSLCSSFSHVQAETTEEKKYVWVLVGHEMIYMDYTTNNHEFSCTLKNKQTNKQTKNNNKTKHTPQHTHRL